MKIYLQSWALLLCILTCLTHASTAEEEHHPTTLAVWRPLPGAAPAPRTNTLVQINGIIRHTMGVVAYETRAADPGRRLTGTHFLQLTAYFNNDRLSGPIVLIMKGLLHNQPPDLTINHLARMLRIIPNASNTAKFSALFVYLRWYQMGGYKIPFNTPKDPLISFPPIPQNVAEIAPALLFFHLSKHIPTQTPVTPALLPQTEEA